MRRESAFFLKSSLSLLLRLSIFSFVARHLFLDAIFSNFVHNIIVSLRETTRPRTTTTTTTTMLLNPLLPTTTTKTTTLMMTRAGRPTTQGRTPPKRHHHLCVDVRSAKKEEKAKQPKGGLTKKRCDACLGAGKVPCYNCTTKLTGWGDGRAVSVADKVGYVPKKTSLFSLPFGWKTSTSANNTKKTKTKKTKEKRRLGAMSRLRRNNARETRVLAMPRTRLALLSLRGMEMMMETTILVLERWARYTVSALSLFILKKLS